jgi:hypothetical protein
VHYYAIAERGSDGWYLTFPGSAGYSFAAQAEEIVAQARDWLATVAAEDELPRSIEDGATPPADLSGFTPETMIVVIPFAAAAGRKAA